MTTPTPRIGAPNDPFTAFLARHLHLLGDPTAVRPTRDLIGEIALLERAYEAMREEAAT